VSSGRGPRNVSLLRWLQDPGAEGRLWLPVGLLSPCRGCDPRVLVPAEVAGERSISAGSAAALARQRGYDAFAVAIVAKRARTGHQGEGDQR